MCYLLKLLVPTFLYNILVNYNVKKRNYFVFIIRQVNKPGLKITAEHRAMFDQNQKFPPNEKHTGHSVQREKIEAKLNVRSDYASVRP